MLIQFSVKNFKSFKEKQVFSMEAGTGDENIKNISSFDEVFEIFLTNFTLNEKYRDLLNFKELKKNIEILSEYYQNLINQSILVNKILLNKEKVSLNCIFQQFQVYPDRRHKLSFLVKGTLKLLHP